MKNDKERPIESYDVVGPICETGDFFIKDFKTFTTFREGSFSYYKCWRLWFCFIIKL
jgi:Diaminopimelate decarboxylase